VAQALRDKEGLVAQRAVTALGAIGPGAREAIPAVVRAAKNDDLRPTAEEAIRRINAQ
jgi:hypothetical protein